MNDDALDVLAEALADRVLAKIAERQAAPVEDEPIPEGGLIEPAPPALSVVPEPAGVSELGEAFRNRGAAPVQDSFGDEITEQPISGDAIPLGLYAAQERGAGHMLTDAQLAAMYRRDTQARMKPGLTAEDQASLARTRMG